MNVHTHVRIRSNVNQMIHFVLAISFNIMYSRPATKYGKYLSLLCIILKLCLKFIEIYLYYFILFLIHILHENIIVSQLYVFIKIFPS